MRWRPKVLARITPGVEVHTHEFVRTGQEDSKFGFGLGSGAAARAVDRLAALDAAGVVEFVGIHAHLGSQVFALDPFAQAIEVLAEFFAPLGLPELVVGGGLGVAYVNGEEAPPMAEWAGRCAPHAAGPVSPGSVRVTAEPGRSIVAAAGVTLYRVGTVKDVPGHRTYVSVDGGMSDNPRPVLYGSGYEAFLPREATPQRPVPIRLVGKHCETGDVVVAEGFVPEDLAVGDVLCTPVPAPTATRWPPTTTRCPVRRWCSWPTGGPDGGPPRDARRPGPPRRLTAGRARTVGAAGEAVA